MLTEPQRLFGGGLRRMSSGYLCLSVITVPEVQRDLDVGSATFMKSMVSSRSFGAHLRMHHPSEHCMTCGTLEPSISLNLAINDSLVMEGSVTNAMYLLLPRFDLTTIVPTSRFRK